METTPDQVAEQPNAPTSVDEPKTWTFFGHWNNDELEIEYAIPGEVSDERIGLGFWDEGLWCDSGTGATIEEAQAAARAPYVSDGD